MQKMKADPAADSSKAFTVIKSRGFNFWC